MTQLRKYCLPAAVIGLLAAAEPAQPAGDALQDRLDPASWDGTLVGPRPASIDDGRPPALEKVVVATLEELRVAIGSARPSMVIELQPGTYELTDAKIKIVRPGRSDGPIVLRAPSLGSVRLKSPRIEAIHVLAPYWTFENLVIEGVCADDSDCEHAFHVVGNAVGTVIQNNWITNFNAAIKVNGVAGRYPDGGLIRRNAFINEHPRATGRPVAVLDFVSASRWRVQRNFIADFAKTGDDRTSYGAFFKGAGEGNIFEQNVVRCEWRHTGLDRVGFSFGADGTALPHCRDGSCAAEHRGGIARNNVIMDCPNHAGIYLSKSDATLIHNNALIATRGIELRYPVTDAAIVNNIIDGSISARDGGVFTSTGNLIAPGKAGEAPALSLGIYVDPRGGDLRLMDGRSVVGRGVPMVSDGLDLCGQPLGSGPLDIGPIQYSSGSECAPLLE